jgi:hypothetical protein
MLCGDKPPAPSNIAVLITLFFIAAAIGTIAAWAARKVYCG